MNTKNSYIKIINDAQILLKKSAEYIDENFDTISETEKNDFERYLDEIKNGLGGLENILYPKPSRRL